LSIKIKNSPSLLTKPEVSKAYRNLAKAFFGGATELGRGLRQLKEQRQTIDFQALEMIRKNAKDKDLVDALDKFAAKNQPPPPSLMNKFIEFSRNVKLWAASSLVRSVVGNVTMQLFKYPETFVSSIVNRGLAVLAGTKRDRFAREIAADLVGMKSGLAEGFQAAGQIIKENDAFLKENLFIKREFGKTARRAIKGEKGRILRLGQNMQGAIDAVFRIPATRGEIRRRAVRQALQEGLEGSKFHERVEQLTQKFLNDPEIFKDAQENAATQTFQNQLGEVGRAVNKLRQAKGGIVQLVIPFFNTATNLFKEFIKRTPLSLLRPTFWSKEVANAVKKKEIGGLSDSLSKIVTGTTFFIATNELIGNIIQGRIHGRGPQNTNERSQLYAQGWQPYSIELPGGVFVSYLGFEPVSSFLGAMADYNEGYREGGLKKAFEQSVGNIVDTFAENPFLQGVVDLADLIRGRRNVGQYLAGVASGAVIPSVVRQSMSVLNPALKRKPETFAESLSNRFFLDKVEDRFSPLGKKAIKQGTIGNLFAIRISKDTKDPVLKELNNIGLALGPGSTFQGERLTEREKNKLNEVAGKQLYVAIMRLISNPSWNTLTEDAKKRVIMNIKSKIFEAQKYALFAGRNYKRRTR
jgi:hypothetical protein